MRMMSALSRFGLLFLGFVLLSVVSADEVWENPSSESLNTNHLAVDILGDWGMPLLFVGMLMAMPMIGAAYLVRDERSENLEWETKGGRDND